MLACAQVAYINQTDAYGAVLDTERWTNSDIGPIQFTIAVPTIGTYQVRLLFAGVWHRNAGTRVFHINLQGRRDINKCNRMSKRRA